MSLSILLAIAGTALGVYYWYLGFVAGAHLLDSEKRKSPSERIILSSLAWSLGPGDEYSEQGKSICKKGNIVFVLALLSWFGFGVLR